MKYQTLLRPTSPRLAALEAKLGKEGQKPEPRRRRATLLNADGTKSIASELSHDELEAWFWRKIVKNKNTGCWEWTGGKTFAGYGIFSGVSNVRTLTHRFAAKLVLGHDPESDVLHNCPGGDNPACVNPSHLWLGDQIDNMKDLELKRDSGTKLHRNQIADIRQDPRPNSAIAKSLGVSIDLIQKIRRRIRWESVP